MGVRHAQWVSSSRTKEKSTSSFGTTIPSHPQDHKDGSPADARHFFQASGCDAVFPEVEEFVPGTGLVDSNIGQSSDSAAYMNSDLGFKDGDVSGRDLAATSFIGHDASFDDLRIALAETRQQLEVADLAEEKLQKQLANAEQKSAAAVSSANAAAAAASTARREAQALREENLRLKTELEEGILRLAARRFHEGINGLLQQAGLDTEGDRSQAGSGPVQDGVLRF